MNKLSGTNYLMALIETQYDFILEMLTSLHNMIIYRLRYYKQRKHSISV